MALKGSFPWVLVAAAAIALQLAAVPRPAGALTCADAELALLPCVPYLEGEAADPSPPCCDGVLGLKNMATTPADERQACLCLKEAAAGVEGLQDAAASALPARCHVQLPFPISNNTDCNRIS